MASELEKGSYYPELIYKSWFRKAILYQEESNAKNLISEIVSLTDFSMPIVSSVLDAGETKKVFLMTNDGLQFEMVIIPMKAGFTLCVSSQVGCKMGCAFCETGKMGLLRSLKVEEIVSQLFIARHVFDANIRNIVFMGMGEPFDNYDNVMQAINIFTDMNGCAIGPKHITVSTSGLVDKILQFSKDAPPSLNLALSINASTDQKRDRLMPVNKTYDMARLRHAMEEYLQHPRREILIEYVLIEDRNDSIEDADSLASYLQGLKVKINLIPYNPQNRSVFKAPAKEKIDLFFERLKAKGFPVLLRTTKGDKIMAACGQLGKRIIIKKDFC